MAVYYYDHFEIPGNATLDYVDNILQELRAVGQATFCRRDIWFMLEAEDLWDLRGLLEKVINETIPYGYDANKERISGLNPGDSFYFIKVGDDAEVEVP